MLSIGTGITLAVLDSAIANTALPTIAQQLHVSPAESVWVINAYQLAIVSLLLPLAAFGERIGYRRIYQAGIIVFTLGSLACALSGSLAMLVTARVFQGVGAAGIMSVNGALVRFIFPHSSLGRGVGINAMIVSVAAAIGPTIASGILAVGPWEWLFAVNVPIGVLSAFLAARVLPYSDLSERRPDWASAALNAAMFGLFFIAVDTFTHQGGGLGVALVELLLALACGALLVRRESTQSRPLIPIDLLRRPIFALSVGTSVCSFAAYMLAFLAMPFYFESALHRDQVQTGLLMTPWPAAVALVAPIAGPLSDRVPASVLGSVGLAALACGLFALWLLPLDASTFDICWRMALCGLGFGFFQAPNNRTMLGSAPRDRAGAAGGMLATARLTGQTGGATIAALLFRLAPGSAEKTCLVVGIVLAVCGGAVSLMRANLKAPATAPASG